MLGVINQVLLVRMGRLRERLVTDTQLELLESLSPPPTLSLRQGPKTRPILQEAVSLILEWDWVTIRGSVVLSKSYTQFEWALLTLRAGAWKVMRGLAQISGTRSRPKPELALQPIASSGGYVEFSDGATRGRRRQSRGRKSGLPAKPPASRVHR